MENFMWFRREQKNRRLSRGHVLDVKLRSDQVRATRMRMMTVAFGVVFGTVFGLYLLWRTGEWALDKFVYENADFAIQRVDVQTDGVIAPEQLRRWSGVKLGANLIALDLVQVKRNLELVSAIDSVSVERVLPRTLKIRVSEREPVAQVICCTRTQPVEFPLQSFNWMPMAW
jgi:cell division septal protein FtsQ